MSIACQSTSGWAAIYATFSFLPEQRKYSSSASTSSVSTSVRSSPKRRSTSLSCKAPSSEETSLRSSSSSASKVVSNSLVAFASLCSCASMVCTSAVRWLACTRSKESTRPSQPFCTSYSSPALFFFSSILGSTTRVAPKPSLWMTSSPCAMLVHWSAKSWWAS